MLRVNVHWRAFACTPRKTGLCKQFRLQFFRCPVRTVKEYTICRISVWKEQNSRLYPRIARNSQVHAKISDFVRKLTYPVCAVAGHLFAQKITANTFLLRALHCNLSASTADNGFKRLNRFRAASYYFAPAACLSLCACQQLTDQPVWCAAHFNWIIYSRSVSILLRQNSLCGLSCFQKAA